MTSKDRVFHAFKKKEGLPDTLPIQFDLCPQLIDYFSRELGIEPEYVPSYYEDLTYRISANNIRVAMGSDCIVVGGTNADGFKSEKIQGDITVNEFGMHMKPTKLYVEQVKYPLANAHRIKDIESYPFPNPDAPGRFEQAKKDIDSYGSDYFIK